MRRLPLFLFASLLALAAAAAPATIEPKALVERLAWGDRALLVLDVRTPAEYSEGHIPGAVNITHTELASRIAELDGARDRDLVVYCRSGNRSAQAIEVLKKAGFTRLLHLKGGMLDWSAESRPVTRPQ
jgi:phage shock protein E